MNTYRIEGYYKQNTELRTLTGEISSLRDAQVKLEIMNTVYKDDYRGLKIVKTDEGYTYR